MKKIKVLPVLFLLLLFSVIVTGCGAGGKGDPIAQKWQYKESYDKDGKVEDLPAFPNPTFECDGTRATLTLYLMNGIADYESFPYSGTVTKRDDGNYDFLVDNAKKPFTIVIEGNTLTVKINEKLRYIFEAK